MKLGDLESFDKRLEHMIIGVKSRYNIKASINEITRLVKFHYRNGDITSATPDTIIEILDANGIK